LSERRQEDDCQEHRQYPGFKTVKRTADDPLSFIGRLALGQVPVIPSSTNGRLGSAAEQDLLRGGDGLAGLNLITKVVEDHLQGRQAADDVHLVHVAHVADPDDLPLDFSLAADGGDTEPFG
jgi:hypothetical protein